MTSDRNNFESIELQQAEVMLDSTNDSNASFDILEDEEEDEQVDQIESDSQFHLQAPILSLTELEAHSIHSLEELEAIDELEARLGLRLMLVNEAQKTSESPEVRLQFLPNAFSKATYEQQYRELFNQNLNEQHVKENLVQKSLRGDFRSNCFRSICWKIFLNLLSDNEQEWEKSIKGSRDNFNAIKRKYEEEEEENKSKPTTDQVDHESSQANESDLNENNPLSQQESSWWHRYFQNNEIRLIIEQDVSRTFPEVDFFHQPNIQSLLRNLLFIYARQHPDVVYKQGMHELLAPLVFVLHSDHQAFLHAKETNILSEDIELIERLEVQLSEKHLEADAYNLFEKVMEQVKCWYLPEKEAQRTVELGPFSEQQQVLSLSILGRNLQYINETLLKSFDFQLYQRLQSLQIEPQIYGIRWLRLLFGREFPIEDLLVLWDAIFSQHDFQLCNYIFVAMLIVIRPLLMNGEYFDSMSHLMRYPHVPDVSHVVHLALHLQDPQRYSAPEEKMINILPNAMHSTFSKRSGLKQFVESKSDHQHPHQAPHQSTIDSNLKNNNKNRFVTFAQKLMNTNRRTRNRSYTLPEVTNGSSSASSSPSNDIQSNLIRRLRLNVNTSRSGLIDTGSEPEMGGVFSSFGSSQRQFCVQNLNKQIQVLQSTLQKNILSSVVCSSNVSQLDDTLAMAIAELKKIRDVIDGSLLLNELPEVSSPLSSPSSISNQSNDTFDSQQINSHSSYSHDDSSNLSTIASSHLQSQPLTNQIDCS